MEKDELRRNLRSIQDAIASVGTAGSSQSATLDCILRQTRDIGFKLERESVLVTKEFQVASSFRNGT